MTSSSKCALQLLHYPGSVPALPEGSDEGVPPSDAGLPRQHQEAGQASHAGTVSRTALHCTALHCTALHCTIITRRLSKYSLCTVNCPETVYVQSTVEVQSRYSQLSMYSQLSRYSLEGGTTYILAHRHISRSQAWVPRSKKAVHWNIVLCSTVLCCAVKCSAVHCSAV